MRRKRYECSHDKERSGSAASSATTHPTTATSTAYPATTAARAGPDCGHHLPQ